VSETIRRITLSSLSLLALLNAPCDEPEPTITIRGTVMVDSIAGCDVSDVDVLDWTVYVVDASGNGPIIGAANPSDRHEEETGRRCMSSGSFTIRLPRRDFYQAFIGLAPQGRSPEALELSGMSQPSIVALQDLAARSFHYEIRIQIDATGRVSEVAGVP
jgi:hypothetical protein